MVYLVSRHSGAINWCKQQGIMFDKIISHLSFEELLPGDVVIGTLPINIAEKVISIGGRYIHLTLSVPEEWRGCELSSDQLNEIGAGLLEYNINVVKDYMNYKDEIYGTV